MDGAFAMIYVSGYTGWVSTEYHPVVRTEKRLDGVHWPSRDAD